MVMMMMKHCKAGEIPYVKEQRTILERIVERLEGHWNH